MYRRRDVIAAAVQAEKLVHRVMEAVKMSAPGVKAQVTVPRQQNVPLAAAAVTEAALSVYVILAPTFWE